MFEKVTESTTVPCVAAEIAEAAPESVEVFNERATELTAVTGEKTVVGRFFRESVAGEGVVGTYVHANGKLAVLVVVDTDKPATAEVADFAKNVAMQVAAANPLAVSKDNLHAQHVIAGDAFFRGKRRHGIGTGQVNGDQAVGTAAALCAQRDICPTELPVQELRQILREQGAILDGTD